MFLGVSVETAAEILLDPPLTIMFGAGSAYCWYSGDKRYKSVCIKPDVHYLCARAQD